MPVNKAIKSAERNLTEREKDILQTIIQMYILKAAPIGSRLLAKQLEKDLNLSAASIRNVMSDLEDLEYISHPHTSAGRIPTDKGYRFYVDYLMKIQNMTGREILKLQKEFSTSSSETVLRDASKVLGMLSHYLGIVEIPQLNDLIVLKLELIALSSNKLLVVLALDSNIVRTVTLESTFEVDIKYLEEITRNINEKISGKPLNYIRSNFIGIIKQTELGETPLIRLFIDSMDKIFENQNSIDRIHIAGAQNLLKNPEFENLEKIKGVIELVENEEVIVHLLDYLDDSENHIKVLIGSEINNEILTDYSMILTNYQIGSARGSIGLIGPKRMHYSKMISLVKNVSELISIGNK